MKYVTTGAVAALTVFVIAGTASAQHGGGHHGRHVPAHHGIYYGHSNWHHVVPHRPTYVGGYYTAGSIHYYTPSPIVPIVTVVGNPAAPMPVPVEVQKPVELTFGGYSRYEDLAGRLSFEANALCLEMHYNYRHNKHFAEVYGDAYAILQAAKSIYGKQHGGDRVALNKQMVVVDQLFHRIQEEMRGWTRVEAKQVGGDALPEKVAGLEAVLHHLCYDVGVKPHEEAAEAAAAAGGINEEAPPPPARP